jgi:ribonuclease VapC
VIVDASAIVAMVEHEPEADIFVDLIAGATSSMSVATWLEAALVLDRRSPAHARRLDELRDSLEIELVPVSLNQGEVARDAYRRFGRGSGSPARLNYGDCFAYALAITTGESLLFTGDDFGHTDVRAAWLPDEEA